METIHNPLRIGIIGAGRAGSSMGALFKRAGHTVLIWDQAPEVWERASHWLGDHPIASLERLLNEVQWLLVALPDQGIRPWLVEHLLQGDCPSQLTGVMHLSGALGTAVFSDLPKSIARIALHPMRAFAAPVLDAQGLAETYFGITADSPETEAHWRELLPEIAPRMVTISEEKRSLYHAAAVTASNFTVPLLLDARQMYMQCGIDAEVATAVVAGLVQSSLTNFLHLPGQQVLTGPLTRGDVTTVAGHLEALVHHPNLDAHYRALCAITLELAKTKLDEGTYHKLLDLIHATKMEDSL